MRHQERILHETYHVESIESHLMSNSGGESYVSLRYDMDNDREQYI